MNIEDFRDYCLSIKGATESFPFDENTLVFKVMGKMFAYGSISPKDGKLSFSMKCDPDKSIDLREKYIGITKGKHTTSNLWNAVYLESDVPNLLIKELVQHSVDEIIKKLPKVKQTEYNNLNNE
ncbi:MmcQ/YjbR family DNA-binding protein [Apibacter muscae]|uniref:MmcQ/YjbR family DNA-binding protein n=1 Tax=Apibacter muscae TaxID=2509004 RepID=A0A563DF15_9FLAO|nr:MmcQ/YjbR family DNA-binding protein [Apibacter muscae]TWP24355.1 MmcQ/YjbR family DNA-binding protein [Apibacter muscae]TWP28669.1 MmcQ/YjbR family DNA-binding protein [Apibacter muscae]TWP30082.1 MmcQ/YjbR family DNA-binding protein [Apibacter muscae]